MEQIMFTCLMSVYRREHPEYLRAALESLKPQCSFFSDVVLVEDGPIGEELHYVIDEFSCSLPMNIIRLSKNHGLAGALNIGLNECASEWIFRFDTDDVCVRDRAALQWQEIQRADVDILGGQIQECDTADMHPLAVRRVPCSSSDIISFMKTRNPFNHMTVCFKKSVIKDLGGYPELHLKEDYGLWARAAAAGATLRNLSDILVFVRAGREMHARRGGWKYVMSELELQAFLVRHGIKSKGKAVLDGFLRSAVFSSPAALRRLVYTQLLRT